MLCAFLLLAVCMPTFIYSLLIKPPAPFPHDTIAVITRGSTLHTAAQQLKTSGVIRSPFLLELYVHILGGSTRIIAGGYALNSPENVFAIGKRIVNGDHRLHTIKVTIPEGSTSKEIGHILTNALVNFPEQTFLQLTTNKEGYLFPDTYFFLPTAIPEEIIETMHQNFQEKIVTLQDKIEQFKIPLENVVIMASILEREARTPDARRIISGILWERLKIGMPLQVDATFLYINGKKTFELSLDDLAIDSPYNTYKYAGLPVGPIGNPGLDSLTAAVSPTASKYLYYLADKEGTTYYAKTFEDQTLTKQASSSLHIICTYNRLKTKL